MEVLNRGSTAIIKRYKPSIIIKCPNQPPRHDNIDHFSIEKQILEILGPHPRIVNYLGISQTPLGLLFTEANCGDLQRYLDTHTTNISDDLRLKWCFQAAEAIAYIHSRGVIHSDLRPDNFLLHTSHPDLHPSLLLSDFGSSYAKTSEGVVIDGGHLPDSGFFNPLVECVSTIDTDIFALGSVFYVVVTGHWPYKSPGPFVDVDECNEYDDKVNELFLKKEFPDVGGLVGGDIIRDCWIGEVKDAGVIVERYRQLLESRE